MTYHPALLLPTSDPASLHRSARRARARANRQLGRGLIAGLRRLLRRRAELSARRRAEAATLRELRQLSDRALADIGLERTQIREIARSLVADRARALAERESVPATAAASASTPAATPAAARSSGQTPAYPRLVTEQAVETAAAGDAARPLRPAVATWAPATWGPAAWISRGATPAHGRALREVSANKDAALRKQDRGTAACCG